TSRRSGGLRPGVLLERERELSELEDLAAEVLSGSGQTIVIEGRPGVGKSTLITEGLRLAARQPALRTVCFRCGELEQELSRAASPACSDGWLPTATTPRLIGFSRVPPAPARRLFTDPARADTASAEMDGYGVIHALFTLVIALAVETPLLILLDDGHWADRSSLQFLAYLQRRLADLPVGLVIAMRPPQGEAEADLLERIATGPGTRIQSPAPLAVDSVATLVHAQGFPQVGPGFCQACWEVTAGNPFYLHELLLELREDGIDPGADAADLARLPPPSVMRSVLVRLGRLHSPRAGDLARATAVLGDGASLRHAAALAGIDREAAVDALDTLSGAELLELLAAVHAPDELVALHHLHAPLARQPRRRWCCAPPRPAPPARARPRAQSASCGALEEPPPLAQRAVVLAELAAAETAIGDTAAIGHFIAALELTTDPERRAELLCSRSDGPNTTADGSIGRGRVRGGRSALPAPRSRQRARGRLSDVRDARAQPGVRRERADPRDRGAPGGRPGRRPARTPGPGAVRRTVSGGHRDGIIELAERLWAGGRLLEDQGADSQALWHVVGALSWADAYPQALAVIRRVLTEAEPCGLALARAQACYARSWPHCWMGRIDDAACDARTAIEIWQGGLERYLPAAIYDLGLAELERGDQASAAAALALAEPADRWQGTGMRPFLIALEGHLHLHAGRLAQAAATQLPAARRWTRCW
ncbi:MAG: ATP-binding protein, partial [Actinomycetota bacterium]|nr:ATP-binding protein [Actinomycetota bacterium]